MAAYRIETERLLLRCHEVSDYLEVGAVVRANLDRLLPWIPWTRDEPRSEDDRVAQLRKLRGTFDRDEEYVYGIFAPRFAGGAGLYPRIGQGALEIGYWIDSAHEGRGLVTEAVGALVRVAFEIHRIERVEIHCDPANDRSASIPRRLGFTHDATLRRRLRWPEERPVMVWSLFADELAASPASRVTYAARDAIGRPIGA